MFQDKKKKLPCIARVYLALRDWCISPPLDVTSIKHMNAMLLDMESGEIHGRSAIETAVLKDVQREKQTGKATTEN